MTPIIELRGVSRVFPGHPDIHAVRNCDFAVNEGEFVSIVGASGSGKSTLLNLLGLLDRPTSGQLLLDGIDVQRLTERERTRLRGTAIGFVFQSFELLNHRTALENVMLAGLYSGWAAVRRRDASRNALTAVGLDHRAASMPSRMSGGERQRVAIARALAGEPRLLLCDEPTGNLDSRNSQAIMNLLLALNQSGVTVVVISHDPSVADLGSRVVRMTDGVLR